MGKRSRPKIVKATRRRKVVLEPPTYKRHTWCPTGKADSDVVYISQRAVDELVHHCKKQSKEGIEAMGFLAGGMFSWKKKAYTVVRDAVTTRLEASAVSVRFERDGFPDLFENLDNLGYDYILVGWYHSHPGYGCFLSATDIGTQQKGFSEPHHFALVVDPVRVEMKAFRKMPKKVGDDPDHYEELKVGVYKEELWPWPVKNKGL